MRESSNTLSPGALKTFALRERMEKSLESFALAESMYM
jgi:hypothetical protein